MNFFLKFLINLTHQPLVDSAISQSMAYDESLSGVLYDGQDLLAINRQLWRQAGIFILQIIYFSLSASKTQSQLISFSLRWVKGGGGVVFSVL